MDVDVGRFEREGFLALDDGLLSPALVARAAATALESAGSPAKHRAHGASHGHFDFPFAPATAEQALNAMARCTLSCMPWRGGCWPVLEEGRASCTQASSAPTPTRHGRC